MIHISIPIREFENHPYELIADLKLHRHNHIDRIYKAVPQYGLASYEPSKVDSMLLHNHIDRI